MVNDKLIPILIICRDRLECLKKLIAALEERGCKNIILIDNASTYTPLLEYYKTLPHKVVRNRENYGHTVITREDIIGPYKNSWYAYTDPDVIPIAECPADFITRFRELLERHPQVNKVGFGLKIDDLPNHYRYKPNVVEWETQFWSNQIEPGVYGAPIDTTFCLVRPGTVPYYTDGGKVICSVGALRTGSPYIARHYAWYTDSNNIPEDEKYYRAYATSSASHGV